MINFSKSKTGFGADSDSKPVIKTSSGLYDNDFATSFLDFEMHALFSTSRARAQQEADACDDCHFRSVGDRSPGCALLFRDFIHKTGKFR